MTAALALPGLLPGSQAMAHGTAGAGKPLRIAFESVRTGESVNTVYWAKGNFLPEALQEINHVLRDYRTDEMVDMDPELMVVLSRLQARLGFNGAFQVVSAYRSPETNRKLRKVSRRVAKNSFHIKGMAVDFNAPGVRLHHLRRAALSLRAGGVGYYPHSGFIHVDTGPVRSWS